MRVELQVEVLGELQELQMDHSQVLGLMLKVQRRHLIELQYLSILLQLLGKASLTPIVVPPGPATFGSSALSSSIFLGISASPKKETRHLE